MASLMATGAGWAADAAKPNILIIMGDDIGYWNVSAYNRIDLRGDPFEIAQKVAGSYDHWRLDRAYMLLPAVAIVSQHLKSYVEYPPRQKPGSFNLDQVLEKLQQSGGGGNK